MDFRVFSGLRIFTQCFADVRQVSLIFADVCRFSQSFVDFLAWRNGRSSDSESGGPRFDSPSKIFINWSVAELEGSPTAWEVLLAKVSTTLLPLAGQAYLL